MNINYTGNVLMAYPEEGMPVDFWEAAKKQNLQSLLSGVFGASNALNTVDLEAWEEMAKISAPYFERLYQCETVSEFENYLAVASAEIAATDYYKKLTNEFVDGLLDTTSLSGALAQWWKDTFNVEEDK